MEFTAIMAIKIILRFISALQLLFNNKSSQKIGRSVQTLRMWYFQEKRFYQLSNVSQNSTKKNLLFKKAKLIPHLLTLKLNVRPQLFKVKKEESWIRFIETMLLSLNPRLPTPLSLGLFASNQRFSARRERNLRFRPKPSPWFRSGLGASLQGIERGRFGTEEPERLRLNTVTSIIKLSSQLITTLKSSWEIKSGWERSTRLRVWPQQFMKVTLL